MLLGPNYFKHVMISSKFIYIAYINVLGFIFSRCSVKHIRKMQRKPEK